MFQFVDCTQNDRATRRLVRSHVMKGKNIGRKIFRPSRLQLSKRRPYPCEAPLSNSGILTEKGKNAGPVNSSSASSSIAIARSVGDAWLTLSFPIELTPYSLQVINQFFFYVVEKVFPNYLGNTPGLSRSYWLPAMLGDEASSHCSIASMAALNEFFLGGRATSPKALFHLSETFNLVKKRLLSNEALSDSTLRIVLSLILQRQLGKDHVEVEIHYEGLKKMIELRGGICQLESNRPLLLKICKIGIIYALQYGGPIMFFRDRMSEVQKDLSSRILGFDRELAASAVLHEGLHPSLYDVLLDVTSVAYIFNNKPRDFGLDPVMSQEVVVSICSRLIRFSPLRYPNPMSTIEAGYHIGLTLFTMTLFMQFDGRRLLDFELVSQRLEEVLQTQPSEHDQDLDFWLMFMGGIWALGDVDRSPFISRIRKFVKSSGVNSWEEAHRSLNRFPWIHELHNRPGKAVWDLVYQGI